MSLKDFIEKEIDDLRATRDDLKVRVHLAKREADDAWESLEKKWQHAEARARVIRDAGSEVADDVGEALELVLTEMREGYEKIRSLV